MQIIQTRIFAWCEKGFKTASGQVLLRTAPVERSRFWPISGCSGRGETHIIMETEFDTTRAFSIKWMPGCFSLVLAPCLSFSLCAFFASSITRFSFFLCSGEFKQLFQLFHHYLGTVTKENNASSCFGCALADAHPLCRNSFFVIPGKSSQVADGMAEWNRGVQGTSLYADGVFFLEPLHCYIGIYSQITS